MAGDRVPFLKALEQACVETKDKNCKVWLHFV